MYNYDIYQGLYYVRDSILAMDNLNRKEQSIRADMAELAPAAKLKNWPKSVVLSKRQR